MSIGLINCVSVWASAQRVCTPPSVRTGHCGLPFNRNEIASRAMHAYSNARRPVARAAQNMKIENFTKSNWMMSMFLLSNNWFRLFSSLCNSIAANESSFKNVIMPSSRAATRAGGAAGYSHGQGHRAARGQKKSNETQICEIESQRVSLNQMYGKYDVGTREIIILNVAIFAFKTNGISPPRTSNQSLSADTALICIQIRVRARVA